MSSTRGGRRTGRKPGIARRIKLWVRGTPPRRKYTWARRALQLVLLLLFSFQFLVSGVIIKGSLASSRLFEGHVPGLSAIEMMDFFAWLEQAAATHSPSAVSIIAVAVVFILYMLLLGRFFCGWVCPMDLLFSLFERKFTRMNAPPLTRPHHYGRVEGIIPLLLMLVYLALSVILGQPFFTSISPVASTTKLAAIIQGIIYNIPGAAVGLALSWATLTGIALFVNIIAEYVFGVKRLWCRFICPIGNIYGFIANRYSPLRVKVVHPEKCVKCNVCSMACPMSIDLVYYIANGRDIKDYRCLHCGRCAEVCPYGVLSLGFRLPKPAGQKTGGVREEGYWLEHP
ncbi:MAG: ferredoxin [Hyperthermus sp.]|nr:MAG: ferredoxin [Hyperthermus sp.]